MPIPPDRLYTQPADYRISVYRPRFTFKFNHHTHVRPPCPATLRRRSTVFCVRAGNSERRGGVSTTASAKIETEQQLTDCPFQFADSICAERDVDRPGEKKKESAGGKTGKEVLI